MQETQTIGQQLSDCDMQIVAAKTAGKNAAQIAAELQCSVDTVYRRLREPVVRAALAEARAEQWRPDAEALRAEVSRSISRLVELRDGADVPPSTQARACVELIELAVQLRELVDVGPRLAALELLLEERGGAGCDG